MYITINYQLISWIEQEKEIELKLNEVILFSLVDSFRRQNKKCKMSKPQLAEYAKCGETTIYNIIRKFKKHKILKVWYPPNQQSTHEACTLWLHDDIIDIIKDLQAVSKNDIGAVSTAVSKNDTNNKRIGDSSSPFEGDSSSQPEDLNSYLEKLNI